MAQRPPLSHERYTERSAILEELFSGAASPQETAERLASISFDDGPSAGVTFTWEAIMIAARQMPQHQEKLIDVLIAFSKLPPEMNGDEIHKIDDLVVWSDLPLLDMEFNYEWNGCVELIRRQALSVPQQPLRERNEVMERFINANAFVARLMGLEPPVIDVSWFALITMRSALEKPFGQRSPSGFPLEMEVTAAAKWIVLAGPQIYLCEKVFQSGPLVGRPGAGGPLWNGRQGFCRERWNLWKRQFAEVVASEDVANDIRVTAAGAVARMTEIERQ